MESTTSLRKLQLEHPFLELSVVIPTYKERQNIAPLVASLKRPLKVSIGRSSLWMTTRRIIPPIQSASLR